MILMDIDAVKERKSKKGYTKAVDFWSLGVMMFDMLTGNLPFKNSEVAGFVPTESKKETKKKDDSSSLSSSAKGFFPMKAQDVVSNASSSHHDIGFMGSGTANNVLLSGYDLSILENQFPDCSIIEEFLNVNEWDRLGSGNKGEFKIRAHPYFRGLSWSKLVRKQIQPPSTSTDIASNYDQCSIQKYANYEEMLMSGDNEHRIVNPSSSDQKHFKYWYVYSIYCICIIYIVYV